jgi:hypothetical protein
MAIADSITHQLDQFYVLGKENPAGGGDSRRAS